jgi:hypothetical protein
MLVLSCAAAPFEFEPTGSLNFARDQHTATLLPDGRVLVAGGINNHILASTELYDSATGTWALAGKLNLARESHTATLLPNGKVLVAAGVNVAGGNTRTAELYDPASGTWTVTGSLAQGRYSHVATLLPDGKVLVAGGDNTIGLLNNAELYDPESGTWATTGSLTHPRYQTTATLLPNGEVLVAGGTGGGNTAELYNPASGAWRRTGMLTAERDGHTATLLPNGKVLVASGTDSTDTVTSTAELYDTGLGYKSAGQPKIGELKFTGRKRLLLRGSLFQGISQASSGDTQDSSTNYPVVQVRNIDGSEVMFLPVDPDEGWSDISFSSLPLTHFPNGPALATVFTNGIPSRARYFVVTP